MADRIQLSTSTKAEWEQFNPVLRDGEMGIEKSIIDGKDVLKFKLGNGLKHWMDLKYFETGLDVEAIQALIDASVPQLETTDVPVISIANEVSEFCIVDITIDNYSTNNEYYFTPSIGTVSSTYPFKWTIPNVESDVIATLDCYAVGGGKLKSTIATKTITILNDSGLSIVADDTFDFSDLPLRTINADIRNTEIYSQEENEENWDSLKCTFETKKSTILSEILSSGTTSVGLTKQLNIGDKLLLDDGTGLVQKDVLSTDVEFTTAENTIEDILGYTSENSNFFCFAVSDGLLVVSRVVDGVTVLSSHSVYDYSVIDTVTLTTNKEITSLDILDSGFIVAIQSLNTSFNVLKISSDLSTITPMTSESCSNGDTQIKVKKSKNGFFIGYFASVSTNRTRLSYYNSSFSKVQIYSPIYGDSATYLDLDVTDDGAMAVLSYRAEGKVMVAHMRVNPTLEIYVTQGSSYETQTGAASWVNCIDENTYVVVYETADGAVRYCAYTCDNATLVKKQIVDSLVLVAGAVIESNSKLYKKDSNTLAFVYLQDGVSKAVDITLNNSIITVGSEYSSLFNLYTTAFQGKDTVSCGYAKNILFADINGDKKLIGVKEKEFINYIASFETLLNDAVYVSNNIPIVHLDAQLDSTKLSMNKFVLPLDSAVQTQMKLTIDNNDTSKIKDNSIVKLDDVILDIANIEISKIPATNGIIDNFYQDSISTNAYNYCKVIFSKDRKVVHVFHGQSTSNTKCDTYSVDTKQIINSVYLSSVTPFTGNGELYYQNHTDNVGGFGVYGNALRFFEISTGGIVTTKSSFTNADYPNIQGSICYFEYMDEERVFLGTQTTDKRNFFILNIVTGDVEGTTAWFYDGMPTINNREISSSSAFNGVDTFAVVSDNGSNSATYLQIFYYDKENKSIRYSNQITIENNTSYQSYVNIAFADDGNVVMKRINQTTNKEVLEVYEKGTLAVLSSKYIPVLLSPTASPNKLFSMKNGVITEFGISATSEYTYIAKYRYDPTDFSINLLEVSRENLPRFDNVSYVTLSQDSDGNISTGYVENTKLDIYCHFINCCGKSQTTLSLGTPLVTAPDSNSYLTVDNRVNSIVDMNLKSEIDGNIVMESNEIIKEAKSFRCGVEVKKLGEIKNLNIETMVKG